MPNRSTSVIILLFCFVLFFYFGSRFHVLNVHTMDELKLTGNSMLGSRPLLNFDAKFDQTPHWQ